jgi:hypothetical protein
LACSHHETLADIFSISISPAISTIDLGDNVVLTASPIANTGTVTYGWTPCSTLNASNGSTVTATPTGTTTYTAIAFDEAGCAATTTATVNVFDPSVVPATPISVATYTSATFNPGTWTSVIGQSPTWGASENISGTLDNGNWTSMAMPILGMPFTYRGIPVSDFGINYNGFMWFGTGVPATNTFNPLSNASANLNGSGTIDGVISAFGADILHHPGAPTNIAIHRSGTSPNRVVTIEWRGWKVPGSGTCSSLDTEHNRLDFQIRLHEQGGTRSNQIEIIYRDQNGFCIDLAQNFQAGLRGANNTDFNNRTQSSGNLTVSSSSSGTANNQTISLNGGLFATYINGNIGFRFTPGTCSSVSTITASGPIDLCPSGSVNFTAQTGSAYQWYRNGTLLSGETSQTLSNVTTAGQYIAVPTISGCPTPSYAMNVTNNATVTPAVSIVSNPAEPFCSISSATFTASPTNGGCSPFYQWRVNGTNVGTSSFNNVYINSTLNPNDAVDVILTSNALCTSSPTANSNVITNHPFTTLNIINPTAVCLGQDTIDLTEAYITALSTELGTLTYWQNAAATIPLTNPTQVTTPGIYYIKSTTPFGCETVAPVEAPFIVCNPTIYWVGGTPGNLINWTEPNNWDPVGVPPTNANIIIPIRTHKPTIDNYDARANEVNLDAGMTLTISGTGSLIVDELMSNAGVVNVRSGGALVQPEGSILAGSGTYNVFRYLSGPGGPTSRKYRFLGSPINSLPYNGIPTIPVYYPDGFQLVPLSNCDPNAMAAGSPNSTILELRDIPGAQVLSNCSQSLWFTKGAGILERGRGYAIYAMGDMNLRFSGVVNNGDVVVNDLARQSGTIVDHISGGITRGWHLVSNPYPSPIEITEDYLFNQGFDNQFHLWNSTTGTWTDTIATATVPVVLSVAQAFEIRRIGIVADPSAPVTLTFTNSMRVINTGVQYFSVNDFGDYRIKLNLSGNNFADNTTIFFSPEATPEFDSRFDVNKLVGNANIPAMFTMAGIERMKYNGLPLLNEPIKVPMSFYTGTNGTYTFSFDELESLPSTAMVYLEDKKTGIWTNMRVQESYSFNASTADNVERFMLHFEPPVSITAVDESCVMNDGVITIVNPANETWSLTVSKDGNVVNTTSIVHGETNISNLAPGTYTLDFVSYSYTASEEAIVEAGTPLDVSIQTLNSSYEVYDIIEAHVENPIDGVVYTWYLNDLPAGVGTNVSFAISDAGDYTIRLEARMGDCISAATANLNVESNNTTSVKNMEDDDFIRAFPNPANELVTIVWKGRVNDFDLVRVMDVSGRTVQLIQLGGRTQGNQLVLDLGDVAEGLYLISLEGQDVNKNVKVTVVH